MAEPGDASAHPPIRSSDPDIPRAGRLIGVDWGERRIGLALSDPTQTIAQPFETLVRRTGRRFPMREFRVHLDGVHPVGIVVGLPLDGEGAEGQSAAAARDTGEWMARATGLPVAYQDERMTTSRARRAVDELGGRVRGREHELDQLAATVMLQHFLDRRRT